MTHPHNRDSAQMDEIMASIRRIVADQDQRIAQSPLAPVAGDVFVLTPDMRIDDAARVSEPREPQHEPHSAAPVAEAGQAAEMAATVTEETAAAPDAADATAADARPGQVDPGDLGDEISVLSADESAIVDISRAVIQEELAGGFDGAFVKRLREIIREEIAASQR